MTRLRAIAFFISIPISTLVADEVKPAAPVTKPPAATTPGEGRISGFFKSLNKKSADLKAAVDKTTTSSSSTDSGTASGVADKRAFESAAPAFNNDLSTETTEERVREVLSRGDEWGEFGSNTSGFKKVNHADPGALDGFGPLKWQTNQSQSVAALIERGATAVNSTKDQPGVEVLNFQGGSFAGQLALAWQLYFFKDQLFEARVEYVYPKGNVLREYRKILSTLETKYGKWSGEQDLRFLYLDLDLNYESKKRNSRGDEEKHWFYMMRLDAWYAQALAAQSAQPMARWVFANDNTLTFWITGRSKMMLQYRNAALAEEASGFAKKASSPENDL